jgi:hypothetical protein
LELSVADVDIDGDGHAERLLKYVYAKCDPQSGGEQSGIAYFIVDRSTEAFVPVNVLGNRASVFEYRKKVYFACVEPSTLARLFNRAHLRA